MTKRVPQLACPVADCNAWVEVVDSRPARSSPLVRRRKYQCANLHTFSTLCQETITSVNGTPTSQPPTEATCHLH